MCDERAGADTMAPQSHTSVEELMSAFSDRISLLQQVLVIRSCSTHSDHLSSLDIAVRAIEDQLKAVRTLLDEESKAIPKAKVFIGLALAQERRLKHIYRSLPSSDLAPFSEFASNSADSESNDGTNVSKCDDVPQKEKKGRSLAPRWYITVDELDSLSSYMRGRLTLEKINAAVDEMAAYAEANGRLLTAPRKKLGEDMLERALELRDFAASEGVKGKHFFFETDMRGPVLKLDNTGKAILTVLRHLGRISDVRSGKHRALILLKP